MADKIKVFIAEDDITLFNSLKRLLLISDFEVEGESQGLKVVERVEAAQPDVLLLDLRMPDLDGFTISKTLKANDQTKHIHIIVLSGLSSDEDIAQAKACGAVDYFSKPYDYLKLVERIKELVK